MGGVVVYRDKGRERDGTIRQGEGGNGTLVIHSRRKAIILTGEVLRAWKAMDQKREDTKQKTVVTVGEMREIAVSQSMWNVAELQ